MRTQYPKFIQANREQIMNATNTVNFTEFDITTYVSQLMFYKHLCQQQVELMKGYGIKPENAQESDIELVQISHDKLGYFITANNLFDNWINLHSDFGVSDVHAAMSSLNRLSASKNILNAFEFIFIDLQVALCMLGEITPSRSRVLQSIIHTIK